MKIYDTHSDVFSNLYERHQKGEKNIFERYHLSNMTKGEVKGGIWVVYSEYDFDLLNAYKIALKEFEPYKDKFDVVLGLEGLRNVPDLDYLQKFYDLGVRHCMLTWNEENKWATGVAGPKDRGLTEDGKKCIKFMEDHNMIVDVSHLNVKSFFDVMDTVTKPVIASHSDAYTLRDHRRNLNDEQLAALKKNGGYVGVNTARNFVSLNKEEQNCKGLADHIDYLVKKLDIDHIMFGFDMMDFLDDYGENANLDDLANHGDSQNIVHELLRRGYTLEDVEKICYKNFLRMRKELIGY